MSTDLTLVAFPKPRTGRKRFNSQTADTSLAKTLTNALRILALVDRPEGTTVREVEAALGYSQRQAYRYLYALSIAAGGLVTEDIDSAPGKRGAIEQRWLTKAAVAKRRGERIGVVEIHDEMPFCVCGGARIEHVAFNGACRRTRCPEFFRRGD